MVFQIHLKVWRAIKDGTLGKTLKSRIGELRAECAYFYAENGKRTAQLVFGLKDASQIPEVVEPLFVGLNAVVELFPAMKSLEKIPVSSGYEPHG